MNLYRVIAGTRAEGPGLRFAIWTQGCSRRCEGCMLPETWDFSPRQEIAVCDLLGQIRQSAGIEGITVLGGEPFEQAKELAELLRGVRKMGLSVIVFTGYRIEELWAMGGAAAAALRDVDVLADGEYVERLRSFAVPMIGSENQRFHFLTDRYRMSDIPPNRIEVRIGRDGRIQYNGMGDFRQIKKYWEKKE